MIGIMSDAISTQRIIKLPKSLANQIAAGEVIERPASVVKELLENSLDARASKIIVDVENGGSKLIRVVDNGDGIHADDLKLAFDRHATSKLSNQADLERIISLGFRGEALSSIAAVSRCKLSACEKSSTHGYMVEMDHKNCSPKISPVAHPVGTTVEVKDLFFKIPGRRKFLRSEKTEFLHIQELVRRIALSRFNTSIRFSHNGRSIFQCNNNEQEPEQRLALFFGQSFLIQAFPIDISHSEFRLWGWLGSADAARSHTDRQYFFLNGRIIRDKQINHAIRMAYQDLLYPGRYPVYVLYFEIDAAAIDVNVHPTKHEVRFRDARNIHDFIHSSLMGILHSSPSYLTRTDNHPYDPAGRKLSPKDKNINRIQDVYTRYATTAKDFNNQVRGDNNLISIMQGRFILIEAIKGLILIDAFRARELILSVRLLSAWEKDDVRSRPLLVPLTITVREADINLMLDTNDLLQALGIVIEQIATESLLIREVPVLLANADITMMINHLIDLIQNNSQAITTKLLIDCMKMHANDAMARILSSAEMRDLVSELRSIENELPVQAFNNAYRHIDQITLENLFK
jgi:DNA mismatch repair protein MutL